MQRTWVLGAADPEMSAIEAILMAAGETVVYAVDSRRERVYPANAYRAVGHAPGDALDAAQHRILVECDIARPGFGLDRRATVVDHHRPGDPGYGRPPAEYFAASSIGQVLAMLRLAILHSTRADACRVLSPHEGIEDEAVSVSAAGDIMASDGRPFKAIAPGWNSGWPSGKHGQWDGLPVPAWFEATGFDARDLCMIAAADHCLTAAYRGMCPGVEPDALMRWRVASRAAFQRRQPDELAADVEAARLALRNAPAIELNPGCGDVLHAADMRGQRVAELPEASAREGICFVSDGLVDRDGRVKVVCQSGTPEQIEAFMRHWAPLHGLVDIYGDPQRGFAGGYLAPSAAD